MAATESPVVYLRASQSVGGGLRLAVERHNCSAWLESETHADLRPRAPADFRTVLLSYLLNCQIELAGKVEAVCEADLRPTPGQITNNALH